MTEHLLEIQQKLDSPNEAIALFGNQDAYLKLMENELNVSIITRGEKVYVSGQEASRDTVSRLITSLLHLIRKGIEISERDVVYAIKMAQKTSSIILKICMKMKLRKMPKASRSESKRSASVNMLRQ